MFVFDSFKHRPTRSWLTILGIFIGIMAVVALISLSQGLQESINEQFELLNPNTIYVFPGGGRFGAFSGFAGAERLTDHDVKVVDRVRGVDKAAGFTVTLGSIEHDDELIYTWVMGYDRNDLQLTDISSIGIEKGREFKAGEKFKTVVGYNHVFGDIFDKRVKVGDTIIISENEFEVVGVAEKVGNPEDDKNIYIPLEAAKDIFSDPGYALVYAVAKKGFEPIDVADDIATAMRKDRGLKKGEEDFSTQTNTQMMESFGMILTVVEMIVIGISAISVVVGGVGIMNTMYTSVLERTREIGIMKAIGAKNSDILLIFLIEAGALGLAGGIVGILAGMGIGTLVGELAAQFAIPFGVSFPPWLIGGALAFSFLIGSISGALPAIRASGMKPADALKYD